MFATTYQYNHIHKYKSIVIEKIIYGLLLASIISSIVIFMNTNPLFGLLAFIGEIIAIFIYIFSKNESTVEKGYYLFVISSSILLGYTLQYYIALTSNGMLLVASTFGITTIITASIFYYTSTYKPDVSSLPAKIMPFSLLFVGIFIVSIFVSFGSIVNLIISIFGAILFSLYLYYDFGRIMKNQIYSPNRAAWSVYWDILLVFKFILNIIFSLFSD